MKVFIVDDSKLLLERLEIMLSEIEGVEISGRAGTSREAIAAIKESEPDVVILDIHMPDGSGIDVLSGIKKNKRSPVVIIFTSYPYPEYKETCLSLGADFFFDKSTEFDRIREALEHLSGSGK